MWQEVAPLVQEIHGLFRKRHDAGQALCAEEVRLEDEPGHAPLERQASRSVEGISLTTLLWTDGRSSLPCDCRLYEPAEKGQAQVTKDAHFLAMLPIAKEHEFRPKFVCFDGWYSSLANLKAVRGHGWHFLTRLTGISGCAAKAGLIREAVRPYLRQPTITLEATV